MSTAIPRSADPAAPSVPESIAGERLFGVFEAIGGLDLPATTAGGLYEGFHAGFYDLITGDDAYDVPAYLAHAAKYGGPVLELACGSGRVTVPLAQAGYDVTAVDLAPDMLRALRRRLLDEPRDVALRVTPVLGDLRELALHAPHRLAIIGAVSICLIREHADRVRAFKSIRQALEADGRLCFDFLATNEIALRAQDDQIACVPALGPRSKRFTLMGRRWVPEENLQIVNFYSEDVDALGRTHRYVSSTQKAIVTEEELRSQLDEAGFAVESVTESARLGEGAAAETIRLLVCCRA